MGEYVAITTSPAEIMGIAAQISQRGRELASRAGTINGEMAGLENGDTVRNGDQFTTEFIKNYEQSATGADGSPSTANAAIRGSAVYCGTKLAEIGAFVGKAMINYGATDDESGTDIAKTEIPEHRGAGGGRAV